MSSTPVLAIPDPNREFRIEVDASGYAIGGVLSQQQTNNSWRPISFLSQALNETERNYEIYDRELLAIMTGLKHWRQYLWGGNKFEVWTDHKNLEFFRKPQKLNRRQARWLSELQDYDFQLIHKPGNTMKKADTLSRRPDHDTGKKDNEDRILLKEERFRILVMDKGELWKELEDAEEFIEEEVEAALKEGREGWRKEGKVILWKERAYVPDLDTLREEVLKAHHDQELAGHPGYTKTQ